MADLIGTIEEDEEVEVENESSDSDSEAVTVKKKSASEVFNPSFFFDASFIGNDTGFSYDPSVYAKKKRPTATTLDEKIGKVRADRKKKSQDEDVDELVEHQLVDDSGVDDSDMDEEKQDKVKSKEARNKKLTADEPEKQKFEESIDTYDDRLTFSDMNLSRPLVKALSSMNFVQPTPIQSACIPVALKGRDLCACAVTGSGMLPTLHLALISSF
ncbi:DDX27 [Bugula neritina]|uniref:RNA helicase n=1 Tax=Bugula neritina TaxID=10212 RepID=A0A7J7KLW9_BUGNE|nr:DDX27 [Bugula neritina]